MNDKLKILFEDECIIVIDKPRALATQSSKSYEKDVVSLLKEHIKKENPELKKEPFVGVVHRLDQPVRGILVFAKNQKSAANLSAQAAGDIMNKHYYAKVEGILEDNEERELTDMIYKDSSTNKATIGNDKSAKKATLIYKVVAADVSDNSTLVEVFLKTGRFHQIRAQFSNIGHPILGDRKYGSNRDFPGGIALLAYKLSFVHPVSGKQVEFVIDSDI